MEFSSLLGSIPVSGGEDGNGEGGSLTLLMIYATVAIGFSFLCSIAEAVLLSVSRIYIATIQETAPTVAKRLSRLKENIDRPLAAILSLNTIAHTVGAAGVGAEAARIWGSASIGIVSAIMTLLILVLSEIIPKTIGAVYWRKLAPPVAMFCVILIWVLIPLVWLSDRLTRLIAGKEKKHVITRDEVAAMASLSAEAGGLDPGENRILSNLFRLDSLMVRDVMTPRTVMIAFPQDTTVGTIVTEHPNLPVSRVPIYGDSIDDITGLALRADILLAHAQGQDDQTLATLRRDVTSVRDHASLKQLMDALFKQRQHLAIVIDEYGGTDGLVTLEDLIETLLGIEIVDESDESMDMQAQARQQWERRAKSMGLTESSTGFVSPPPADPTA